MFRQLGAALEVQNHYSKFVHSASVVFLSIILAFTLSMADPKQEDAGQIDVTELSLSDKDHNQ